MDTILGKELLATDDAAGAPWADALRPHGLEIVVVGSAGAPLAQWEEGGLDMAIVDVHTHLDGLELCQRLRGRWVSPVLLLAPGGDEAYLLEAYRADADECVPKPIGPAPLLSKVKAWLHHRWTVRAESLNLVEGEGFASNRTPPAAHPPNGAGQGVRLLRLAAQGAHRLIARAGHTPEGTATRQGRIATVCDWSAYSV